MAKQQNLVEAARGQFSTLVFYPGYYNLKPWVGNLKMGFQEATPEQRGLYVSQDGLTAVTKSQPLLTR